MTGKSGVCLRFFVDLPTPAHPRPKIKRGPPIDVSLLGSGFFFRPDEDVDRISISEPSTKQDEKQAGAADADAAPPDRWDVTTHCDSSQNVTSFPVPKSPRQSSTRGADSQYWELGKAGLLDYHGLCRILSSLSVLVYQMDLWRGQAAQAASGIAWCCRGQVRETVRETERRCILAEAYSTCSLCRKPVLALADFLFWL